MLLLTSRCLSVRVRFMFTAYIVGIILTMVIGFSYNAYHKGHANLFDIEFLGEIVLFSLMWPFVITFLLLWVFFGLLGFIFSSPGLLLYKINKKPTGKTIGSPR